MERDRLIIFWEVGKKQLEECRSEARVKDRELEESEERHQTEVKVYKQKVKHLLYEQEHNLAELKAENMVKLHNCYLLVIKCWVQILADCFFRKLTWRKCCKTRTSKLR